MNEFFHLRKSFSSKNDFPTANTFDQNRYKNAYEAEALLDTVYLAGGFIAVRAMEKFES